MAGSGERPLLTSLADATLEPISEDDLEDLRRWKNANRSSFFHKDIITQEEQEKWYVGFLDRSDEHMYVVRFRGWAVGCMGFRLIDDVIDVFNVIRGVKDLAPGVMGIALHSLIAEATTQFPNRLVAARVVTGNPAVDWYTKCGFAHSETLGDHVVMTWMGRAAPHGDFRSVEKDSPCAE